jgi:hypothetical protein
MAGTFATLIETDLEWDAVTVPPLQPIVLAGEDTTFAYSIRRQTVQGSTVTVEIQECGATQPDLCSAFYDQAFTQVVPNSAWDHQNMPRGRVTFTINDPDPGEPYVLPTEISLIGLTLASADGTGTWPTAWNSPGLTWQDHDGDGPPGFTSQSVLSGNSTACALPYGGLPIPSDPFGPRILRASTGSRTTSNLNGTIVDCNTFSGSVDGPGPGSQPLNEGRVRSCVHENGNCTTAQFQSLDEEANNTSGTRITDARFTMVRVADNTTCAQVLAFNFP